MEYAILVFALLSVTWLTNVLARNRNRDTFWWSFSAALLACMSPILIVFGILPAILLLIIGNADQFQGAK